MKPQRLQDFNIMWNDKKPWICDKCGKKTSKLYSWKRSFYCEKCQIAEIKKEEYIADR